MKIICCNNCNSDKYTEYQKAFDRGCQVDKNIFTLVKCSNCNLVYLNPQPSKEELKKYYPADYGPFNLGTKDFFSKNILMEPLRRLRRKKSEIKVIDNKKTDNYKFLDYGCGDGKYLSSIRKQYPNWELYGADNSETACNKTKEKGFFVYCGDIEDIDLPTDYFDMIHLGDVIEHVPNPSLVLSRLYKSMKPGGEIRLITPNIDSFAFYLFRSYWYALELPRHLQIFSEETLSQMLKKNGFTIKSTSFSLGPKVFIKSFYHLIGRRDSQIDPILWKLLSPLSNLAAKFKKTSGMTVVAKKQ